MIDVSPDTYLPVRVIFGHIEMDYRWLQPTAANLAKLTPNIPRLPPDAPERRPVTR